MKCNGTEGMKNSREKIRIMIERGIKLGVGERAKGTRYRETAKKTEREMGAKSELSTLPQTQFPAHEWFGVMTLNGCKRGEEENCFSNSVQKSPKLQGLAAFIALVPKSCVCKPLPSQPTKYLSVSLSPLRSTLEEFQPSFYHFLIPNTKAALWKKKKSTQ